MDKDLSDSDCQTSQDNDSEQSLVNKFKKNVTEIISHTPLSKWFRKQNETPTSSVRRRQDDSDDEVDFNEFQPPAKRSKLPPTKETLSLNVSETLSPIASVNNVKKPVYRNFPEPVAGPSGYQTRKMLNSTSFASERTVKAENVFKNPRVLKSASGSSNNVNNKESQSDSEESTSGYSSGRIGSKEVISQESSKQTSPLKNSPRKARSLFQNSGSGSAQSSDRGMSSNRNSSMSSRMPSFDPSAFGSSNFVDRTLSTNKILNSPFYNGHTIYGGASAYGRYSRRVTQDMKQILGKSINIKPVNREDVNKDKEKREVQLGKTARRILDTLEQYSSPINDAKKIPVASKRFKSEGTLTKYMAANPYSVRGSRSASNKEMQVPSVTDLLKMKIEQQKTRLQDSTEAVRQIATKSKSILNEESYQIPVQRESDRHTGKIKTRITSVRHRMHVEEVVQEVKLNPVSLPIKELPKFDLVVPPPASSRKSLSPTKTPTNTVNKQTKPSPSVSKPFELPVTNTKPVANKVNVMEVKENAKSVSPSSEEEMEFKFSAPLILAEYLKPLKALNNFKFSEPLIKKRRSIHPELDSRENKPEGKKSKKNNGENLAPAALGHSYSWNNSGSSTVLDIFKPKPGTWECSVCMIRNKADETKCAACEASRTTDIESRIKASTIEPVVWPPGTARAPLLFGGKFKAPNTWECPTCMIRNKEDVQKCAACETKKPDSTPSKVSLLSNKVPSNTVPPTFTFGDKFKVPSDTWECPTCMVRNKTDVTKCVACETQKPGDIPSKAVPSSGSGFGTQFAPPSSTWECPACMIRNKDELNKCAACESAKPGAKTQAAPFVISDFKKKDDEWECEVCMVRNKPTSLKCQCCESLKPGASLSNSTASKAESSKISTFNFGIDKNTATGFTFGIPPDVQSNQNTPKTNAGHVFGEKRDLAESKGDTPTFTFGVAPVTFSETKTSETKKDAPAIKPDVQSNQNTPKTNASQVFGEKSDLTESKGDTPTFTFGVPPTTVSETNTSETKKGAWTLGPPKTDEKKQPNSPYGPPPSKSNGAGLGKVTPTFSFWSASKSENTGQTTTTPTFTFGTANKITDKSEKDGGVGVKVDEPTKVNPLLKPSEKLPEKAAIASSGFSFGLQKGPTSSPISSATSIKPNETSSTDESPSKRAKPANESSETPKVPMFTFKAPTTNGDINKTSPFSKSSGEQKPAATAAGGFRFGTPKPTSTTSAIVTPTFGTAVSKAGSSNSGPMFKFGTSGHETPKQTNGFNFEDGTMTSPPSAVRRRPSPKPNQPIFGTTPTKAPMFQFGSASESKTQTSTPSFTFTAPNAENKTTPQFLFGSAPSKTPAFNFGQSSATAPTFSFGSTNSKPDPAFGTGSTPNPFGAANSKPEAVFGATSNSMFVPNGMFNLGAPADFSSRTSSDNTDSAGTAATQSGFSFGSSTATAPTASGGFNFSSSAPVFDANAKPTFNFTGGAGIAAFSAPIPQDGAAPQRKIKKAIRRTANR